MKTNQNNKIVGSTENLFFEISHLIEKSKKQATSVINNSLTLLFWHIGTKISIHILQHKRAEYGKQIVVTLSRQLTQKYGNNFKEKNLRRMIQFAEQFKDVEIVNSLSRHLSWSHFLILLPLKEYKAKHKGQMELYLKWLDRYEKQEGENSPIGLILCAETSREQVELLEMYKDGIVVSEYWTEFPPKKELEHRLHKALIEAKERLERRKLLQ